MVLSYWDLPADVTERGEMTRKRICRTFSDCTTAPRNGIISGCFPARQVLRQAAGRGGAARREEGSERLLTLSLTRSARLAAIDERRGEARREDADGDDERCTGDATGRGTFAPLHESDDE